MARPVLRLWPRYRRTAQARQEEQHNEGIFDDKPVEQSDDDHLQVDHLVNALAGLIGRQHSSLTIGIYGEWGSGKTSFLQLLIKHLRRDGIHPVWFDAAWKYKKNDNLWSALIQTILNQAGKQSNFFRRHWVRLRLLRFYIDFKAGVSEVSKKTLAFVVRLAIIVACVIAGIHSPQIADWLGHLLQTTTPLSGSIVPWLVGGIATIIAIGATDPLKVLDLIKGDIHFDFSKFEQDLSFRDHIAFLDKFSDQFQRLIDLLLPHKKKQLVIIIDDLDRCLPEHALQVLEAIKVLLDNARCIFLLGVDIERLQRQLKELLGSRYDEDYFDKIIQQTINVPRLSQEVKQIETFIRELNTPVKASFDPASRVVDSQENILDPQATEPVSDRAIIDRHIELCAPIFALGLPPNPRKIKRTLRSFRFVRDMILERIKEDNHKPDGDENRIKTGDILATLLAKLIVIREQYKPFYEDVIKQPSLLKQLETSFRENEQNWSERVRNYAKNFTSLPKILSEQINLDDAFNNVEDVHLYIEQIGTLAEMGHSLDKTLMRGPMGVPIPAVQAPLAAGQQPLASPDRPVSGPLPAVASVFSGVGPDASIRLPQVTLPEALSPGSSIPAIAAPSAVAPLRYLPVERNRLFTAREDLLLQLQEAFLRQRRASRTNAWVALCGLGGIGKTQIAVEFVTRYQAEFSAVFWVSAETTDRLVADYIAIAERIYVPERFIENQEQIVEAVKNWLATHAEWLLILDGVTDFESVRAYLPGMSSGNILLTMRRQLDDPTIYSIDVEPFQADDGVLLLLRRAGIIHVNSLLTEASIADRRTAREIVQALDGIPLALDQAGAYIRETGCGLDGYLQQYQENSGELLSRRGYSSSHPEPISATLFFSINFVENDSPAAVELLRLCSFLAADAIPLEMLVQDEVDLGQKLSPALETEADLNVLIQKLEKFSLVRRKKRARTLSLHGLVQTVLREKDRMDTATQRRWAERAIALVNLAFPKDVKFETWDDCQRYLLQALTCASLIEQWQPDLDSLIAAQLLERVGRYLRIRTLHSRAEQLLLRANTILEKKLGAGHPEVVANLNEIALVYLAQGQYTEAEKYLRHALQSSGSQNLDVAVSLNNLAGFYDNQGQFEQARFFFREALSIREETLGKQHPLVAIILNNLAGVSFKEGNYDEAAASYQRALDIYKQTQGEDHPDVALGLFNLAGVYAKQDRREEAKKYYEQALATYEKAVGKDSPRLIPTLVAFASFLRQAYHDQPEVIRQAEGIEGQARAIQELYEQRDSNP